MAQRQPIVAVLGHVDHGKTSLLDYIRSLGERTMRQASVAARESGGITQHIGATEVPAAILNTICGDLVGERFKTSGLLFIDTPGHHSFHTLRRRGGALADIAVVVVDIMEGMRPQTEDSIRTLMDEKTPFVVALNKLDRIHGWESEMNRSFAEGITHQNELVSTLLHEQMMKFIGEIASLGLNAELYTTNREVKSTVSMVPCSAQTGEGIADLLAIVVGLSNTFLSGRLETEEKGRATILEGKDIRGLGRVIDAIVFDGSFNKGDSIAIPTTSGVRTSTVRAMLRPRGMSEMRDAGDRWDDIDCVQAAGGIRISCHIEGDIIPGGTIITIGESDEKEIIEEVGRSGSIDIETKHEGMMIKSDSIGGLEALSMELASADINIAAAGIGPIVRKDIRKVAAMEDPLDRCIACFSTTALDEARKEAEIEDIEIIEADVIYHLIDAIERWREKVREDIEAAQPSLTMRPARLAILSNHVFRRSQPAVVGVRILDGMISIGQALIHRDGRRVGTLHSIRSGEDDKTQAHQGDEVAIAIDAGVVGRNFDEEDILLGDLSEDQARVLIQTGSNVGEDSLEELLRLKRSKKHFWAR